MTKQEAIAEMQKGNKVRFKDFSPDEWMTMKNGNIVLEDGVRCCPDEFWKWRTNESWNDGYSLVIDENKDKILRPKTRGELLEALKKDIKCEVVASNEEITSIFLNGWLHFSNFKTYPSDNVGWVVYEAT